jgi:hypothetical protein
MLKNNSWVRMVDLIDTKNGKELTEQIKRAMMEKIL